MKKYLLIISFLFPFLGSLYASHLNGASFSYRHIGNQKYTVSLKISTSCLSTSVTSMAVNIRCKAGSSSASLALISVKDITGIHPNCPQQSRCASNNNYYKYGDEEYLFRGVIDLSALNCCEVEISWSQFSRNSSITSGQANLNFYTEAIIDKCEGSSIEWADFAPPFVLSVGQNQLLNFSAIDSITHDSISYKFETPLSGAGTVINYASGFSADKPLSFLGHPNNNLNTPAGFHLDAERGNIYFKPVITNQVSVISVEATAWRKINGVMKRVGRTRNEQVVIIENLGSNTTPYQNSPSVFKACVGDTSVAIIELTNLNTSNNYEVNLKHNLRWAKAELLSKVVGTSKGRVAVFFIADSITPSLRLNAFTLEVKDDACPVIGRTVKTYGIEEGSGTFIDSSQIKRAINCGDPFFWVGNKHTGTNYNYSWLVEGKFTVTQQKGDTVTVYARDTGWVKATLYVTSTLHCNYFFYTDSLYIAPLDFLLVEAKGSDTSCFSNPKQAKAIPIFGTAPFTYNWSTGQQGQNITIIPILGSNVYSVEVIDGKGCRDKDTITIINYYPKINLSGDDLICAGKKAVLTASVVDTSSKAIYGWNTAQNNSKVIEENLTAPTTYTFSINDGGCIDSMQWHVDISKPQAQFSYPDSICIGDTLHLKAAPFGGKYPYIIFWNSYNRYGENISINTKNAAAGKSYLLTTITDSLGCIGTFNNHFTLVSPPIITFSPVPPVCQGGSLLNLTQYGNPTGGIWSGTNINNNELNPQTASKGIQQLEYFYTDPNTSCSSKKTTQTKIYGSPQIDFTADSTTIYQGSEITFTNTTQADTTTQNRWELLGTNAIYTTKNAAYTYTDTGIYSVKLWVSDGVCPPDSLTKTNYITVKSQPKNNISVNEIEKGGITVYPNPANAGFTIKTNSAIKSIDVYNSIGVKVIELTGNRDTEIHCDASSLTSGLYFITIQTQEGKHWVSPIFISH